MRLFRMLILVLLLFFDCKSDVDIQTVEMPPPLTNVLTLELSFGIENLRDEYLLAEPRDIAVNSKGDILVIDENRIKVYSSAGKEKSIFGGLGEGPGEFKSPEKITVGPSDYISVIDNRGSNLYRMLHFFAPDFKFIYSERIDSNTLYSNIMDKEARMFRPEEVIFIDSDHKIIKFRMRINISISELQINSNDYIKLVSTISDSLIEIEHLLDETYLFTGTFNTTIPWRSSLFFGITEENNIVYYKPNYNLNKHRENPVYNIYIIPFDALQLSKTTRFAISHRYNQVIVPDDIKNRVTHMDISGFPQQVAQSIKPGLEILQEMTKDDACYAPLQKLFVDGKHIYAFTNEYNNNECLTDVFDAQKRIHINSAYFPFVPDIIKGGYAYNLKRTTETEFAEIRKYKIDPAVYGK